MFTCLKNNGLDDHPNTIASNSTHKKKATSKTASEAHGIDVSAMQFSRFYNTNLQLLFPLFPFYSHTRELVIDCFQSQDFSIFISSYFFFFHFCISSHHFFPNTQIPESPVWLRKGERRTCIWTKLCDQWHVLISSALVSLSCLIQQWPSPHSICLIPTVPKCTLPHILLRKKH